MIVSTTSVAETPAKTREVSASRPTEVLALAASRYHCVIERTGISLLPKDLGCFALLQFENRASKNLGNRICRFHVAKEPVLGARDFIV